MERGDCHLRPSQNLNGFHFSTLVSRRLTSPVFAKGSLMATHRLLEIDEAQGVGPLRIRSLPMPGVVVVVARTKGREKIGIKK